MLLKDQAKFAKRKKSFLDVQSPTTTRMKCIVSISKFEYDEQVHLFFKENQMNIFSTFVDTIYTLDGQKKGVFSLLQFCGLQYFGFSFRPKYGGERCNELTQCRSQVLPVSSLRNCRFQILGRYPYELNSPIFPIVTFLIIPP